MKKKSYNKKDIRKKVFKEVCILKKYNKESIYIERDIVK